MLVQTSFDSKGGPPEGGPGVKGPHITVINHDGDIGGRTPGAAGASGSLLGPPLVRGGSSGSSSLIMGIPSPRSQLSRQGSSVESGAAIVPIHHHTVECSATGRGVHQPQHSKVNKQPRSLVTSEVVICFHFSVYREDLRRQPNATSIAVLSMRVPPPRRPRAPPRGRRRHPQQQQLLPAHQQRTKVVANNNNNKLPHLQCKQCKAEANRNNSNSSSNSQMAKMASVHFLKVLTFDSLTSRWTAVLLKIQASAKPLPTVTHQRLPVQ